MNIVITAGGTSEKIDNVRKITNSSSGKLGKSIANELLKKINKQDTIFYICSKKAYKPDSSNVKVIEVESVDDLLNAVTKVLKENKIDYFIHLMAVSDYTVSYVTTAKLLKEEIVNNGGKDIENIIKNNTNVLTGNKLSSYEDNLIVTLKSTPKVISKIKEISPDTFLVGFKLLDGVSKEELISVAKGIRDKNKCDLVVANDLKNIREGNHEAYIIDKDDNIINASSKEEIANKLVNKIIKK